MSCLCETFITAYFVLALLFVPLPLSPPSPSISLSTSSLPFPPAHASISLYFLPHYPSLPSAALSHPVRPSSGLRPPQPLWLLVLFPGLKPSQTISANVFRTKGQRRWGEVCLGCVMRWSSGGLRMPFLPNANMLIQFLLPFFLSAFCFQIYIIITAALSGSYRGDEVFCWSEVFCPLSFLAWGSSECSTKCIFV